MNRPIILTITLALVAALVLPGQTANPKQPQPKSQKELEAIQAIFSAQDFESRIAAANNLISKFADTEFKATAYYVAADSAMNKGDIDQAIVYAEKCIEADPQFYGAMLLISRALAQRTREFDLDREEKLGRSEKLAKQVIEILKTAPKPRPDVTDEQWEGFKKEFAGQAYEAIAMGAMVRKNYQAAADNFKLAADSSPQPDPATLVRLGNAYRMLKKFDEALVVLDKALADPNAVAAVKQAATQEKNSVNQAKAAATKQP
jgi:tetratricopeptide (TPR) repeat protein